MLKRASIPVSDLTHVYVKHVGGCFVEAIRHMLHRAGFVPVAHVVAHVSSELQRHVCHGDAEIQCARFHARERDESELKLGQVV